MRLSLVEEEIRRPVDGRTVSAAVLLKEAGATRSLTGVTDGPGRIFVISRRSRNPYGPVHSHLGLAGMGLGWKYSPRWRVGVSYRVIDTHRRRKGQTGSEPVCRRLCGGPGGDYSWRVQTLSPPRRLGVLLRVQALLRRSHGREPQSCWQAEWVCRDEKPGDANRIYWVLGQRAGGWERGD